MPVKPPVIVDEIGRVGYDDVGLPFNSRQYVAEDRLCEGQIVKDRIDGAERQRLAVYVCKEQLSALAKKVSCKNSAGTTPAPDVDKSHGLARDCIGDGLA